MQPKLARIHQLLAEGFELDRIESDRNVVETHLQRGRERTRVIFSRSEASELLGSRRNLGR